MEKIEGSRILWRDCLVMQWCKGERERKIEIEIDIHMNKFDRKEHAVVIMPFENIHIPHVTHFCFFLSFRISLCLWTVLLKRNTQPESITS